MRQYRRNVLAGGSYFFTVNLADRRSKLLVEQIDALRAAVRASRRRKFFYIDAWVVLPDHMHCVWTLPEGDADFSGRWRDIKGHFSRSIEKTELVPPSRLRKRERGIWQSRFWEHTIRDDRDFAAHIDYVHLNPVKHGLVERVADWPYSSFHKHVRDGTYANDWLGG